MAQADRTHRGFRSEKAPIFPFCGANGDGCGRRSASGGGWDVFTGFRRESPSFCPRPPAGRRGRRKTAFFAFSAIWKGISAAKARVFGQKDLYKSMRRIVHSNAVRPPTSVRCFVDFSPRVSFFHPMFHRHRRAKLTAIHRFFVEKQKISKTSNAYRRNAA